MPNLANITVKKADGTTNVVYAGIVGSTAGSPAVYRATALASARVHQPSLEILAVDNGDKSARRVNAKVIFPVTRVVNGEDVVIAPVRFDMSSSASNKLTDAEWSEVVAQAINLFTSAEVRAQFVATYAAT